MPFDGSGKFTRSHDFTQDRDNGIKILATRMDEEFDNFAVGMNQVFFRNGLVSFTANVNFGTNRIVGLGDGAVGAPSVTFANDGTTGPYLSGVGKMAIAAAANKVGEFSQYGFESNGIRAISASAPPTGAGIELGYTGGQGFVTAYDRTAALYKAMVLSAATHYRLVNGVTIETLNATTHTFDCATQVPSFVLNKVGTGYWSVGGDGVDNNLHFGLGGVKYLTLDSSGVATSKVPLNLNVATDQKLKMFGSSNPYLSGFDTAGTTRYGYLQFTAAGINLTSDTGNIQLSGNGGSASAVLGSLGVLVNGTMSSTGAASFASVASAGSILSQGTGSCFLSPSGDLVAYRAGGGTGGVFLNSAASRYLYNDGTQYILANQGLTVGGNTSVNGSFTAFGTINCTGTLFQNGNAVWHNGNLTPANYALLASPALTGTPTINGVEVGYRRVPQNAQNAAYQLALADDGGHVYYTGAAAAITIPANATTAIPRDAVITIINDGSGVITLTRAGGVTLKLGGTGANADRSIAVGGIATLLKVGTNTWFVSGPGVT